MLWLHVVRSTWGVEWEWLMSSFQSESESKLLLESAKELLEKESLDAARLLVRLGTSRVFVGVS